MEFFLEDIARALGVTAAGNARIAGWSVDSRTLAAGDLFFALRGPNHDGNAYVEEAFRKGAAAAVAERPGPGVLVVGDAQAALEKLAGWARQRWGGQVIGITGSAGKTSTKDVAARMLSVKLRTGKSEGNLNNQVGLPLSILRLPADAQVAAVEIGMNHAGEIRDLCRIARPDAGVVTNVGYAHIENFDSVEGIAAAKRELVEALPPEGVAVLNGDDDRVAAFRFAHPGRTVTFGFREGCCVRAEDAQLTPEGARFRVGGTQFETRLVGHHAILNILAGIATANAYGIETRDLRDAAAALAPGKMRGERFTARGVAILNDCYNSNPEAARRMLDVLRETPARRRIAVLGEMLELGRWSPGLHREIGRYAAESGVAMLVAIGGAGREMAAGAIAAGVPEKDAHFFEDAAAAGEHLRRVAREGDAILFKGSRGARVERALEAFLLE